MFRRVLKYILVIAAVINLIFLFVFDYQIPSFVHLPFGSAQNSPADPAEPGEEEPSEEPGETESQESAEIVSQGDEEALPVEDEEPEEEQAPRCIIISEEGSNIRSGPGTDFEDITAYAYNTILTVTGDPEGGWYPVQSEDGTEGYIFESQIRMLEEGENTGDQTEGQAQDQP